MQIFLEKVTGVLSMKAEIICIGTELLLGQIVDTNAVYLAQELADLGIDLYHKTIVGDNLERIVATLQLAWSRADLVLLSGGLGPTQDDLTREAVAQMLQEPLNFCNEAWEEVQAYFNKVKRIIPESNRRQAMYPLSGQVILNPGGTAPGILIEREGHSLFAFPGVPHELKLMWENSAKPYLQKLLSFNDGAVLTSKYLRMVGIGEAAMEEQIMDLIVNQTNPTIAPYAGRGEVCLRVTAKGRSLEENQHALAKTIGLIEARLHSYIYGSDETNLETVIGQLLKKNGLTLAVTESCTGGLISHRLTNVPGSSAYYLGGVNAYSNQLKIKLLNVPLSTIERHGAVSPETARAMVEGICTLTKAEIGLAITGIAGPDGGSTEKPVGLVYFGLNFRGETFIERRIFPFDRIGNKEGAAQVALTLLWQHLK